MVFSGITPKQEEKAINVLIPVKRVWSLCPRSQPIVTLQQREFVYFNGETETII
jgi:hypothetical protein